MVGTNGACSTSTWTTGDNAQKGAVPIIIGVGIKSWLGGGGLNYFAVLPLVY